MTPLGLIYDTEKKVNVIIDERMIEKEEQKLLFHPLSNEFTLFLSAKELKEFLNSCGQKVTYMNFNKL